MDAVEKCPDFSQKAQPDFLGPHTLSHTDSFRREEAEKGNAEIALVATSVQKDLKNLRKANCPPRDEFALFISDLTNPNLKKKKINEG